MLLMIVVIALVAGVSFVNLGLARNAALAANQIAHARYDEAARQNKLLVEALASAQQGQNVLPKAYDYFSLTPPDVMTIEIKPAVSDEDATAGWPRRSGPPYWDDWWQRLVKP
jgi:hypothetical protein